MLSCPVVQLFLLAFPADKRLAIKAQTNCSEFTLVFCCTAQLALAILLLKIFMADRSRRALYTNPGEDLSKLSSEVLKLRLQALNLPITGSKGHLLSCLKRATQGNAAAPRRKPQKRLSQPKARRGRSAKRTAIESRPSDEAVNLLRRRNVPSSLKHEQEDSALLDRASLSSIESNPEPDIPIVPSSQQDTGFSPVQRSAIEAIVTQSVHSAFSAF